MMEKRYVRSTGSGTGFVVRSNNGGSIVLTASHVVRRFIPAAGDRLYVRSERLDSSGVQQMTAHVLYKHRNSDVAILSVLQLRNVPSLVFDLRFMVGSGIIAVGFADPEDLFNIEARKRISDLSPGSFVDHENGGVQDGVNISNLHLDMITTKGMSGCPVVSTVGTVGMLITGEGECSNLVSNETIFQVMKQYYKNCLHQATPTLPEMQLDAIVNSMMMVDVIDALPL